MNVTYLQNRLAVILGRYDGFLRSLEFALIAAQTASGPLAFKKAFDEQAESAAKDFIDSVARDLIDAHALIVRELGAVARDKSLHTNPAMDGSVAINAFQIHSAQSLARDIRSSVFKQVFLAKRQVDFLVAKAIRTSNRTGSTLSEGFAMAMAESPMGFTEDAKGRKISARRNLATLIEMSWTRLWNVSMYYLLMSNSEDLARVSRPGHEDDGTEFPVEIYPDIERRIFHPNSWALLLPSI